MVLCWYCTGHSVSTIAQPCWRHTSSLDLADGAGFGSDIQLSKLLFQDNSQKEVFLVEPFGFNYQLLP